MKTHVPLKYINFCFTISFKDSKVFSPLFVLPLKNKHGKCKLLYLFNNLKSESVKRR